MHESTLKLLAEVLKDRPNLRQTLIQFVHEQREAALRDEPDVKRLEAEREELKGQIDLTLESLTGAALADARPKLERLGARRNEIEARLTAARRKRKQDDQPVETLIDDAIKLLEERSHELLNLPIAPLRDLVNKLVLKVSVDMETKEVELTLALPTWAIEEAQKRKKRAKMAKKDMCPETSPWSQDGDWTQRVFVIARCEYQHRRGSTTVPPCYECSRLSRAA